MNEPLTSAYPELEALKLFALELPEVSTWPVSVSEPFAPGPDRLTEAWLPADAFSPSLSEEKEFANWNQLELGDRGARVWLPLWLAGPAPQVFAKALAEVVADVTMKSARTGTTPIMASIPATSQRTPRPRRTMFRKSMRKNSLQMRKGEQLPKVRRTSYPAPRGRVGSYSHEPQDRLRDLSGRPPH
jgi:hypothetical protein